MKTLIIGIVLIILLGIGGLVYRNAVERPDGTGICDLDAKVCPDGTVVGRTGPACEFAECPISPVSQDLGTDMGVSISTSSIQGSASTGE